MSKLIESIESRITEATGRTFRAAGTSGLGGGCIHKASMLSGVDGRRFFIKQNTAGMLPAFDAEAMALGEIAKTATLRVPQPIGTCKRAGEAALILEYLPLGTSRSKDWQAMGRQFARMHRHGSDTYGWPHENWIGSTPQINDPHPDWIEFLRSNRLGPQVEWARKKNLRLGEADNLMDRLPGFFVNYHPAPSLLHGDLWAGNAGFLEDGTPVIFDPAAYYGDREADLAMTEMFGGFPAEFYAAYHQEWPLHTGYRQRKGLYLLYHTLNHYNLFGGGYGSQAEAIINGLLESLSGN